jgi:hypothetical protein
VSLLYAELGPVETGVKGVFLLRYNQLEVISKIENFWNYPNFEQIQP